MWVIKNNFCPRPLPLGYFRRVSHRSEGNHSFKECDKDCLDRDFRFLCQHILGFCAWCVTPEHVRVPAVSLYRFCVWISTHGVYASAPSDARVSNSTLFHSSVRLISELPRVVPHTVCRMSYSVKWIKIATTDDLWQISAWEVCARCGTLALYWNSSSIFRLNAEAASQLTSNGELCKLILFNLTPERESVCAPWSGCVRNKD